MTLNSVLYSLVLHPHWCSLGSRTLEKRFWRCSAPATSSSCSRGQRRSTFYWPRQESYCAACCRKLIDVPQSFFFNGRLKQKDFCFLLIYLFIFFSSQVACLYACYVMGYITPFLMKSLISVHMVGVLYTLQFYTLFQQKRKKKKKSSAAIKMYSLDMTDRLGSIQEEESAVVSQTVVL